MKLLIMSDSHGNYPLAYHTVEQAGLVDYIIHLGDGLDDAQILERILDRPILKVSGNCDGISSIPKEIRTVLAQRNFLITHGDQYGVKLGLKHLIEQAAKDNIDVILYGHTHLPSIEKIDNVLLVNPGCLHKACSQKTYAIITVEKENIYAEIIHI